MMAVVDLGTFSVATTKVACQGHLHAIRWEAGELVALDHDDPEGERALAALGGTEMTCIEVLSAWAKHRQDPRVLTVCTRGPGDRMAERDGAGPNRPVRSHVVSSHPMMPGGPRSVVRQRRAIGGGGGGWFAYAPLAGGPPHRVVSRLSHSPGPGAPSDLDALPPGLALLAGLANPVPARLVASVTAALLEDLARGGAQSSLPSLEASLFGRAWSTLASWLEDANLEGTVEVARPDGPGPALEARPEVPSVHASLPLRWVADVWGRGMAVVAGRFALGLLEATPRQTVLETVDLDFGPARPVTVSLG